MLAGQMYNKGQDGVLRLCIEPEEKPYYLKMAHETIGGIHMAGNQTLKRLLWAGVWWPSMKTEAHNYVLSCKECVSQHPKPYATLFQVMVAPKWSSYIVYLKNKTLPENFGKARRKAIELESKDYEIIADQLYKRGKDKQLRLCVTEVEYVRVLEQAHAGLTGGHFSADNTAKAIMMAGL